MAASTKSNVTTAMNQYVAVIINGIATHVTSLDKLAYQRQQLLRSLKCQSPITENAQNFGKYC